MRIIAITGLPLAGKSVVTKKLEDRGYKFMLMRSVVEAEMKKKNIPINNETLRNFATELRVKNSRGIVAELCIPEIKRLAMTEDVVVVDGLRSPEEVDIFKKEFGDDFVLISIWAPVKLRYLRAIKTRLDHPMDEPKTLDELKWRDVKELGWGLAETMIKADYMIVNTKMLHEYEYDVDRLLDKIFLKQH